MNWQVNWSAAEVAVGVVAIVITIALWWLDRRRHRTVPTPASVVPELTGLKVSSSFGFFTFDNPPRLGEKQMLFIVATNTTPRPIRVEFVSMNIENSTKQLAWIPAESNPSLPCVLQETESVRAGKPLRGISQSLLLNGFTKPVRLQPFVQDSYNVKHYGDWVNCDPQDWARK